MTRRQAAFDCAVLGGGPAGLALALTLRRHAGRTVVVIEKTGYDAPRIGETLAPGVRGLLDYLGALDSFAADGHLPSFGTAASWGSAEPATRDFILTPFGAGWHLDRRRFDATLAREAETAGAIVLRNASASVIRRADSGWRLDITQDGEAWTVRAPFLVDATGKAATVARRAGARRHILDRLVAVAATVACPGDVAAEATTLVETCEFGWWYSAKLPGSRMIVALMSDSDLVRRYCLGSRDRWRRLLLDQRHTWMRVRGGSPAVTPQVIPALSACVEPFVGADWLAVGDAACCQDPLSASGIPRALDGGIRAALGIARLLKSADRGGLDSYARRTREGFVLYWRARQSYYALERRWPVAPFWQRRQSETTPAA